MIEFKHEEPADHRVEYSTAMQDETIGTLYQDQYKSSVFMLIGLAFEGNENGVEWTEPKFLEIPGPRHPSFHRVPQVVGPDQIFWPLERTSNAFIVILRNS